MPYKPLSRKQKLWREVKEWGSLLLLLPAVVLGVAVRALPLAMLFAYTCAALAALHYAGVF